MKAHELHWEPGHEGKGLIDSGNVFTWNVDEYGDPHHADYLGLNQTDDTAGVHRNQMAFYIKPDGTISYSVIAGGGDPFLPTQVDSRLHYDPPTHSEWNDQDFTSKNRRQGSAAFAAELKLWLDGLDPEKAMQQAWLTPHHQGPQDFVQSAVNTGEAKWKAGGYGKGFIDWDGPSVYTWNTSGGHFADDGEPTHAEVQAVHGLVPNGDQYHAFWIDPQGKIDHVAPDTDAQALIEQAHPGTYTDENDWKFGVSLDTEKPKPQRKQPRDISVNDWELMKLEWAMSDDGEGRPYPFPPQPEHWRNDNARDIHQAADDIFPGGTEEQYQQWLEKNPHLPPPGTFSINNTLQDFAQEPDQVEDWEPGHEGKVLVNTRNGDVHVVKSIENSGMPDEGGEYSHVELAVGRGIPDNDPMYAGWVDGEGKYFGSLIPKKYMPSVFDTIKSLGGKGDSGDSQWGNFAKVANEINVQWHHIPEEQKIDMSDPWAKKMYGDMGLDEDDETVRDNSLWHDPQTNTIHIGVPALHHADIVNQLGRDWDEADQNMNAYWVEPTGQLKTDSKGGEVYGPTIADRLGVQWGGIDKDWDF